MKFYNNLRGMDKSLANNSLKWRLLHSFSSFMGGGSFLAASVIFFPIFYQYIDAKLASSYLFIAGSICYLLSNLMEWKYRTSCGCKNISETILYCLNFAAIALYLRGSINFQHLRQSKFDQGMEYFLMASALITVTQTWKLLVFFKMSGNNVKQVWENHQNRILIDLCGLIGGIMYIIGTLIFKMAISQPKFLDDAYFMLSLGGLFYFTSSCYTHNLYFWSRSGQPKTYFQGESVPSIQLGQM